MGLVAKWGELDLNYFEEILGPATAVEGIGSTAGDDLASRYSIRMSILRSVRQADEGFLQRTRSTGLSRPTKWSKAGWVIVVMIRLKAKSPLVLRSQARFAFDGEKWI